MNKEIRCYGCGAVIQSEHIDVVGFTPASSLHKEKVLCQRCFKMKHYHELKESNMSTDDFLNIIQTIAEKDVLIVYMVDIFDFNGSMISGIQRHLLGNDMLVVANKRDVLPKSIKDSKIKDWIRSQLNEHGIKPLETLLISAKKNYELDKLMESIQAYRKKRDVYVVGATNVGKSSLINAILKHYTDTNEYLITTSEFPGTTLDLIEIPFDEHHSLYDTPGIVNENQMAHYIDKKDLRFVVPKNELKPKSYQLNEQQTLYFGGLARIDFIQGERTSFICYFPTSLEIHRTKTKNADALYDRGHTLRPIISSLTSSKDMVSYSFKLDAKKTDIVISGLGWVSVQGNQQKIIVKAPKGVGVMLRRALI